MKSDNELMELAKKSSNAAYSKYSNFPVGACALFESGNTFFGCNVENSSYGLSLCAERNALSNAISNFETSKLIKIAIYSPKSHLCFPCGACLQWIFEFAKGFDTDIILLDENNNLKSFHLSELLPFPFSAL